MRLSFLILPIGVDILLYIFWSFISVLKRLGDSPRKICNEIRLDLISKSRLFIIFRTIEPLIGAALFILISYATFNANINPVDITLYIIGFLFAVVLSRLVLCLIARLVVVCMTPLIVLGMIFNWLIVKILKLR